QVNKEEKISLWNEIEIEIRTLKYKEDQYNRLPHYLSVRVRPYIEKLVDMGYNRIETIDLIEKYDESGEGLKINFNNHSAEAIALLREIGEEIQEYNEYLK